MRQDVNSEHWKERYSKTNVPRESPGFFFFPFIQEHLTREGSRKSTEKVL